MEIVSLALVGAVVSVLVQFIKFTAQTSRTWTIALVVAFSLLGGGVYFFFKDTNVWQSSLQILLYANAVYGFIIKYFEA